MDRDWGDPFSDTASESTWSEESSDRLQDEEDCKSCDGGSTTLSDPELPVLRRESKMENEPQLPEQGHAVFARRWRMSGNDQGSNTPAQRGSEDPHTMSTKSETGTHRISEVSRVPWSDEYVGKDVSLLLATNRASDARELSSATSSAGLKAIHVGSSGPHSRNDDFEGEVYEEVENLITGERQQVMYGSTGLVKAGMQ